MLEIVPESAIRDRFPALQRQEAGHPVAYFDGPGGTQVPRDVADAMSAYLLGSNANTGWAFPSSAETDAVVAGARSAMADVFGCGPDSVSFGANMTTLTFHLSRALGRELEPGDEIVVTRLDHRANVDPWRALEQERGVVVRAVPFDPVDGTLDVEAFHAALGERTRLVALGWASNALGTVVDLPPLLEAARRVGARTFVDAVHAAPHVLPDVEALGCDFMACSPYKFYGPHSGALYCRDGVLDALDPPRLACAGQEAPERFETGTLSHEALAGITAAVDFLASVAIGGRRRERLERAYAGLHERGGRLVTTLWDGLSALPGVVCHGPAPDAPRTPTVAFTVEGRTAREVAAHLAATQGVFVSHGDFYAPDVVETLGVDALVRAGCACYTTGEEVERLVAGVEELAGD